MKRQGRRYHYYSFIHTVQENIVYVTDTMPVYRGKWNNIAWVYNLAAPSYQNTAQIIKSRYKYDYLLSKQTGQDQINWYIVTSSESLSLIFGWTHEIFDSTINLFARITTIASRTFKFQLQCITATVARPDFSAQRVKSTSHGFHSSYERTSTSPTEKKWIELYKQHY
jgi:hypothetical protein